MFIHDFIVIYVMDKPEDNNSKSLDVKIEDEKNSNIKIKPRGAKRKRYLIYYNFLI